MLHVVTNDLFGNKFPSTCIQSRVKCIVSICVCVWGGGGGVTVILCVCW